MSVTALAATDECLSLFGLVGFLFMERYLPYKGDHCCMTVGEINRETQVSK